MSDAAVAPEPAAAPGPAAAPEPAAAPGPAAVGGPAAAPGPAAVGGPAELAPEPAADAGSAAAPEPVEGSAAGSTPVERPRGTIEAGDPSQYVRERSVDGRRDVSYPPAPEPLGIPVYDNHTHLEIEDGDTGLSLDEQLERALAVGVHGVVQAGGDVDSSRWSAWAARSHPRVLAAVAIHPNEAPEYERAGELDAAIAVIDELAAEPRVRAIGETGLDFFRTGADGIPAQLRSFEAHIALAKKHGIAMQIHDRDAHDAVLETLERVGAPDKTVFHCFSGDADMARIAADRGYYLSFAGNVTFKNAQNLRDALAVTPLDRILVETDAPFLTPAPYRGRPNAPYLIPVTLRFLAAELGLDADELAAQVAANTLRVYGAFDD